MQARLAPGCSLEPSLLRYRHTAETLRTACGSDRTLDTHLILFKGVHLPEHNTSVQVGPF